MKINTTNYEAFLLDHIEGRLTSHQSFLLKAFIHQHPELGAWEELSATLPHLVPEAVGFDLKNRLFQTTLHEDEPTFSETESLFIHFHEGISTAEEQKKLSDLRQNNPSAEKDFQLFGKSYLQPDLTIVFPEKKKLYKKAPLIAFQPIRYVAVAASVTLLIGWGWWWINQEKTMVEKPSTYVAATTVTTENEPLALPQQKNVKVEMEQTPRTNASLEKTTFSVSDKPVQGDKTKVLPALQSRSHANTLSLAQTTHQELRERGNGLAERLALSNIIEDMAQVTEVESRGAAERVLKRVVNDAVKNVNPILKETNAENAANTPNTSLWELAQKGIQTFNFLTDNDVQLVRVDNADNTSEVMLKSNIINYSRSSAAEVGKVKM